MRKNHFTSRVQSIITIIAFSFMGLTACGGTSQISSITPASDQQNGISDFVDFEEWGEGVDQTQGVKANNQMEAIEPVNIPVDIAKTDVIPNASQIMISVNDNTITLTGASGAMWGSTKYQPPYVWIQNAINKEMVITAVNKDGSFAASELPIKNITDPIYLLPYDAGVEFTNPIILKIEENGFYTWSLTDGTILYQALLFLPATDDADDEKDSYVFVDDEDDDGDHPIWELAGDEDKKLDLDSFNQEMATTVHEFNLDDHLNNADLDVHQVFSRGGVDVVLETRDDIYYEVSPHDIARLDVEEDDDAEEDDEDDRPYIIRRM